MSTSYPSLGKYKILEEIGRGGMGAVYKAHDPFLDRTVAIKLLAPHLVLEPGFVERFLREARAAGRLQHPNIIPVYDVGQEGSNYYFVMACLPGASLKQRIAQKGRLEPVEALPILRQLADALDYAHGKGLVHRDVKPANVMFDERGQAVLMDFGIVKAVEESRLTGTGASVGTPHYMAPEQVKGAEVDARADQYALAIVAFEMLTGNVPFDATTTTAVLFKQVNDPPPSICKLCPDLPRAVEGVMNRALAKSPDKRYATCGEFVKALEPALAQAVTKPRKPVEKKPKPKPTPPPVPARPVEPPAPKPTVHLEAKPAPAPKPVVAPAREARKMPWPLMGAGLAVLVIVALVIIVASGKTGPATPTPMAAIQPSSTATPAPTSTLQQTPMLTGTPMPPTQTPTLAPTLRASTPVPQPAAVIALNSISQVTKLAEWNAGAYKTAFSPDSKLLALGRSALSLWDVSSGRELRTFSESTNVAQSVAFSPDGTLLASGMDSNVKLREVSSGHELRGFHIRILRAVQWPALCVAFSPDGSMLAAGARQGILQLWDVVSGRELRNLSVSTPDAGDVRSIAFSPDGQMLASVLGGEVKLWQVSSGRELRTLAKDEGSTSSVAFSPDSKLLATGSKRSVLWDVSSGRELRILYGHADQVQSVAFSPDGELLASGSWDKTIKLWEVASGRELLTLPHTSQVMSVVFSPDGKLLASGAADGTVRVWGVR